MLLKLPSFLKKFLSPIVWDFPEEEDAVFLTFDDGPTKDITYWVLDLLDKYKAKATFFCIARNVEMYPEIYREIIARGHRVGNHSYSHVRDLCRDSAEDYERDVELARHFIDSDLYRPPYGVITPKKVKRLKDRYKIVMWSILGRDYVRSLSGKAVANNVVPHLYPGAVIVFHDSVKCFERLKFALPLVLEAIKEKNYKCKSISI